MVMWISRDDGQTWSRHRQLTWNSPRNHTYAHRPLNAHPDFYAFWADGDALKPSESHLYFTNRQGDAVWTLPETMAEDFQKPEPLKASK